MIGLPKTNMFILAKIKIFKFRDLWLFLIGIFFVSMTSGAIGAFMFGVSEEDFFIGGADNILVVAQPGVTTPLTSKVPEYLKIDIQKIKGVVAVSSETICISIAQNLNDKSIIVRGITPDFSLLTNTSLIEGSWFDPAFDETTDIRVNGAMVGYLLAEKYSLSCGDRLQLASTRTDVLVEVVITGIIRSDTPTDEELLVSLSKGKTMLMTGTESNFVSFYRVLVDEKIITIDKLSNFLNEEYTVPILLSSRDPEITSTLVGTPIVAYTPHGAHVATQLIQEGNRTEFQLKFGTYEFVATHSGTQNSPPMSVFVNHSFMDPFEIIIGRSYYNLQLNITYNKEPAVNASVYIEEKFHQMENHSSQANVEGLVQFSNIPENFYYVSVQHHETVKNTTIKLNRSKYVNIELVNFFSLNILNISSGQEVQGGTVEILNTSYLNTNYKSGEPIYLDPGTYQVEFNHSQTSREFSTIINGGVNKTIYVGYASFEVWTRGENETPLNSTNVSISRFNETIAQALTNSSGVCEFQLEVGFHYNVTGIPAENQSKAYTRKILFINSSELMFRFLDTYKLDVVVFNGTKNSNSTTGLINCNVVVLKNSTPMFSDVTNVSGIVTFNLTEQGIYQIIAEKDGFQQNKTLEIYRINTTCPIKLGNVQFLVSTTSISGYPISEVEVLLKNDTGFIFRGITNSSGHVELFFPVGNYLLQIVKGNFSSQKLISFRESQRASFLEYIELKGDLTITLTNQFSQAIPLANVVLTNGHYGVEYIGFTDDQGVVSFYSIPWTNYSVLITYFDEVFPRSIIEFVEEELGYSLQIETINPILNIDEIKWERDYSFSVVLSSEYVSSFLQSSLIIILTTLTSLVIIVSVLSLLSIASVISQPIVSNEKAIGIFKRLGATRNQVTFGMVVQLSILGLIASTLGGFFGMWILTVIPTLKNINVGGIIIRPQMNFWLLLVIILSNMVVVILKASQKVSQLCSLH